jgi:outer membrane protein OmpA-like peptidoglycan-associated protein
MAFGTTLTATGNQLGYARVGENLHCCYQVLQLVNQASGQVVVDGYTDVGGDEADNINLSQQRCASIQTWLEQHGVSPTRFTVQGHGSSAPRFANPITDGEHQANRRVEVTIYG